MKHCAIFSSTSSSSITLSALLLASLLLVGCGQKGPLYMPDDTQDSAVEQEG